MIEQVLVEREISIVTVRISDAVRIQRDELVANGKCLGCGKERRHGLLFRCGQCPTCYMATRKALRAKRITKSELIREGKLLPATRGGRKPTNAYSKSLAER